MATLRGSLFDLGPDGFHLRPFNAERIGRRRRGQPGHRVGTVDERLLRRPADDHEAGLVADPVRAASLVLSSAFRRSWARRVGRLPARSRAFTSSRSPFGLLPIILPKALPSGMMRRLLSFSMVSGLAPRSVSRAVDGIEVMTTLDQALPHRSDRGIALGAKLGDEGRKLLDRPGCRRLVSSLQGGLGALIGRLGSLVRGSKDLSDDRGLLLARIEY